MVHEPKSFPLRDQRRCRAAVLIVGRTPVSFAHDVVIVGANRNALARLIPPTTSPHRAVPSPLRGIVLPCPSVMGVL